MKIYNVTDYGAVADGSLTTADDYGDEPLWRTEGDCRVIVTDR